jgi:carbonic anhydrase
MNPEPAPAAAPAAPTDKPPRFAPKLLIVAAASALVLVLLVGAATWWLWPKAADAPVAKAASGKAAARKAAVAATAAAASAPTAAASSASAPGQALATVPMPASAAVAVDTVARVLQPAPHDGDVPPALPSARAATTEEPLDRVRRRLAQVLGTKGEVDTERSGELRVLTRSAAVAPVAHAATGRAEVPAAAPHAAPERQSAAHWSYEGRGGPQAWGSLNAEFSQCAVGQRQSPIDIRDGIALDLDPVQFDYQPSSFSVIDNGHTVQVNVVPGNSIEANGRRFALQQFHFHRPSEERINGRQFEMDVHLVHKDAEGRLAVVAVLLERGAAQPLLQTVWNHLPLEKNEEFAARAQIDLNQLLPTDRRYYTYMGSLTTPPCSEGVLWLVMQQPVPVSPQQIDIFSRLYPMNARPIQRAAGRMIKQSN